MAIAPPRAGGTPHELTRVGQGAAPVERSPMPLALLVGAVAALVASRPLADNSFLTHLATGRLLLEGGLPERNPFLFTGTDFPVPSWWWSSLLALAERLGGAGGIRLLAATVASGLGTALVRLSRPAPGIPARLSGTVLPAVLALCCVYPFLSARPHLVGFLLLAIVLVVHREERSPWWMLAVFIVWVNVHGSWVYGLGILAVMVVARAVDDRRLRLGDVKAFAGAVGGVLVGGALYPRAFELLLLPARQFGDPVERAALSAYREWAPVSADRPVGWALAVLGVVALVGAVRSRRWAGALTVLLVVSTGWSSMRLVPVAAITLVPFTATAMGGFGALALPGRAAARRCVALAATLVVATVVSVLATPGYRMDRYPVGAVDWLEARGLVAGGERVLSHDYVGNYLEWRFGPRANAYVDDRPDAATLVQYRRILRLEPGWRRELSAVTPDVVVWRTGSPLRAVLASDPEWVVATEQGDFTVLCHVSIAPRCD